jgi:hypothetical protein
MGVDLPAEPVAILNTHQPHGAERAQYLVSWRQCVGLLADVNRSAAEGIEEEKTIGRR